MMICELIGMDIVNFFMYDGGIVLVEVVMFVLGYMKKKKIVVLKIVYFELREVLKMYVKGQYIEVVEVFVVDGVIDLDVLC